MFFQTPITLIVAFIFMWITIGPSCLAGLAVVIILVPTNGYLLIKYVRQIQVILPCSFHTVWIFVSKEGDDPLSIPIPILQEKEISDFRYFFTKIGGGRGKGGDKVSTTSQKCRGISDCSVFRCFRQFSAFFVKNKKEKRLSSPPLKYGNVRHVFRMFRHFGKFRAFSPKKVVMD